MQKTGWTIHSSLLVWKRVSLWMWSLGGSSNHFPVYWAIFGMVTNERTNDNQVNLEQACSWPVWEGSLLQYQRKKSSCLTTKSHLICPSFYSHGKVARNVNCDIEFASSVTLGASCESVTVASCESETEAKCKLIRCCLRSERSRRQNPALRNSGKLCQGHNSHTTLWIAQDQPHIPFWPIGHY